MNLPTLKSRYLLFTTALTISMSTWAQKVTYKLPEGLSTPQVRVTFKKVSTTSSSYHVNYKAENIGNGVLVIDRERTSLIQNEGVLYPTSDTYAIKPGKNKTVYNQFRVKGPVKANADLLTLKLEGLRYAKPGDALAADTFVLAEKATQSIGSFGIKVMEYNVYSDRIYTQLKVTYNGHHNTLGNIDLSKLNVSGGNAKVVKKGDVLFSGKSYSFAINITPNGDEVSVNFDKVLSVLKLHDIKFDAVNIQSTTYVAPKEEAETEATESTTTTTAVSELSYSDFTALKNDIQTELNNGGKPIEMAHEFLLEKGGISVAQIIEVLEVFNLDGSRLKFAKMAYPFTSDKGKYPVLVGKMEYTKNKQALEEFLENQ